MKMSMEMLRNRSTVIINAQLLSGDATYRSAGISTYLHNLLSHLQPDNRLDYHVLIDTNAPLDTITLPVTRTRMNLQHPLRRILWEQTMLPIWLYRLQADLLHAPAFVGPILASCPQVITIHDLSFLRFPYFFKMYNRVYLTLMTGFSCRRAKAVIAVSSFTASEIHNLLHIPQQRIHTIYHGVDQRFQPLPRHDVENFRVRKSLPDEFILFLGTLEPRKNVKKLIYAYAHLKDKHTHLVLAGAKGWFYQELYDLVDKLQLKDYIHFPGYIPSDEQVLWYNSAKVFAYLSTYEGFGLPVLEALACGIPTLTSSSSSLPEAAGNGALQVSPSHEDAIAESLNKLLHDDDLRQHLIQNGLQHAKKFTWEVTAETTAKLYSEILD
jgi:glycosyltransferase involved in cell wall biosynthesis